MHSRESTTLQTKDTRLLFESTPAGPQLVELRSSDNTLWTNRAAESLIGAAETDGRRVPLRWKLNPMASRADAHRVSFVYDNVSPRLRLSWEWDSRADFGPVEHRINIENLDAREVWLPYLDSISLEWRLEHGAQVRQLFIEKGAQTPSAEGTHDVLVRDEYRWEGASSTYAHAREGEAREIIPWTLVRRTGGTQSGWYIGIEFSGRTRIVLERKGDALHAKAGLNPNPGPFRTRVLPGQRFESPVIFLGGSAGGIDAAGNGLRRWVKEVLTNPSTWQNSSYPMLVNNSWGSGMTVDESLALRMLHDSADLGLEMFHIDAGWFRGVGDWRPDPKKFPHGLAVIADEAHRLGLKFGLWVDWTQAALGNAPGALNVRDPKVNDWSVADTPPDWKPEDFKGQTIDIGVPDARDWARTEVERIVTDYHLDMLEHDGYLVAQGCVRNDHPHAPPDPANLTIRREGSSYWVESSNSTDVSYHAVRAYYSIHSALRRNHPGLLLEVCNDGGRMVDFGSASHADYFSITDTYDPLSNRRAFYDASHVLPAAMLEAYVEKWQVPHIENFRYMLRSGMMGWFTIMQDTTAWSSEQHRIAKAEFDLYKSVLRPFIRDALLYHVSARPDGLHWDAIEYFDSARKAGVVFAYRGSIENESDHSFPLAGLGSDRTNQVHFQDRSSPDVLLTGRELMRGLKVSLALPNSSELIFFKEITR
jgi:hypothetical protein